MNETTQTPEAPKRRGRPPRVVQTDPVVEASQGETSNTAGTPITEKDYRVHMIGWQAGVSGGATDPQQESQHHYRMGFNEGRKIRNEYAVALKARVVQ